MTPTPKVKLYAKSVRLDETDVKVAKAMRQRLMRRGGCKLNADEFMVWLVSESRNGVWACSYHWANVMPFSATSGYLSLGEVQIDHRVPLSRGGTGDSSNWVISCGLCNRRKGSLTATEFRELCKTVNAMPIEAGVYIWQKLGQAPRWKR